MKFPEQFRSSPPGFETEKGDDHGVFMIPRHKVGKKISRPMKVIASAGMPALMEWEHVSVSLNGEPDFCPSWGEMCLIKSLFWDAEETVMQLHPPESSYVNHHNGCLHLWRPWSGIPLPPKIAV